MSAQPENTPRDLRTRSKEIMDAVRSGQSFTVTRDGHRIGELIPLRRRRRFVPRGEFAAMSRTAPDVSLDAFRTDRDATAESQTRRGACLLPLSGHALETVGMIAWFAWAGYVLGYAALVAGAVALDGRVRTKAVAEALARYEAAKPDPADAVPDDDLRLGIAGVAVLVQGDGGTHRAFWTVIIDTVARGVLEPGTTYDGKPTLRHSASHRTPAPDASDTERQNGPSRPTGTPLPWPRTASRTRLPRTFTRRGTYGAEGCSSTSRRLAQCGPGRSPYRPCRSPR